MKGGGGRDRATTLLVILALVCIRLDFVRVHPGSESCTGLAFNTATSTSVAKIAEMSDFSEALICSENRAVFQQPDLSYLLAHSSANQQGTEQVSYSSNAHW